MKPARRPAAKKNRPAALSASVPARRKIRAELYNPANIEKARRLDLAARAC